MYRDRHIDGYIIAPPEGIEEDIEDLLKNNLPVVLFDRHLPKVETDCIEIDNRFSTYNATSHLIEQGKKNIAYITFASKQTQMQARIKGYKNAMKEKDLEPIVKEVLFNQNEEFIIEPIMAYLKKHTELDAVFFGTDHIGSCGLKVIQALGIKVPSDLAVISFDDYDVFKLYSPPISAIAQPIEKIAENIISVLLNKLNAPTIHQKPQTVTLKTTFNIRASSKSSSADQIHFIPVTKAIAEG
jgi:LacI family transcriptional regulator